MPLSVQRSLSAAGWRLGFAVLDSKFSRAHLGMSPQSQIHHQEAAGRLSGLLSPARGQDASLNATVPPPVRPVCHFLFYTALGGKLASSINDAPIRRRRCCSALLSGRFTCPPTERRLAQRPDGPCGLPLLTICEPGSTSPPPPLPLQRSVPPKRRPGGQE